MPYTTFSADGRSLLVRTPFTPRPFDHTLANALGQVTELVAARLLVVYHLDQQRPMMGSFLDALGIAHENGLIADDDMQPQSEERLRQAATAIAATYPAEDVALYLTTLVWQDFETWGTLADAPESRTAAAKG